MTSTWNTAGELRKVMCDEDTILIMFLTFDVRDCEVKFDARMMYIGLIM